MKRAAFIVLTALVITVCAKAQTVITQKGTMLIIDSSKWTLTGNDIFNKNSGFIGIGTNAPGYKTHISLATNGGSSTSTAPAVNSGLQIEQTTANTSIIQRFKAYNGNTATVKEAYMGINPIFNSEAGIFSISRVGSNDITLDLENGNLGIGAVTPLAPLHVRNTATSSSTIAQMMLPSLATTQNIYLKVGRAASAGDCADFSFNWTGTNNDANYLGLGFHSTGTRMVITKGGRVGIGSMTAPDAPLQVNGTAITTSSLARTFFQQGGTLTSNTNTTANVQVHANGWFWADGGGFVATSDSRIKNIIGLTNSSKDLEMLKRLQVTDYTYIDKISNGSTTQKKLIAQQLQSVYPSAVNTNSGIIPNVFETAVGTKVNGNSTSISTAKAHGFKTGDMVKLILDSLGEKTLEVTVTDSHNFTVAEPISQKIFVYGKKVNDLLSVDYDAVSMLNVSATQELAKELKQTQDKTTQLESENNLLKKDNEAMKKMMLEMKSQLDLINKRLNKKK